MNAAKKTRRGMRLSALALALAMLAGSGAGLAVTPQPGEPNYASLHSYVTRTDEPNVYKVTQSVQIAPSQVVANDVVIMLNGSQGNYRHFYDVVGAPLTFGPDNFPCRVSGDFQWQAAKQLVNELFDPATNPNAAYTRIAIVTVGHANDQNSLDPNNNATGGTGSSHNNAEIWTELLSSTDKATLINRIDAFYNWCAVQWKYSNVQPTSKAYQRAQQIFTPYTSNVSFTPTGGYTGVSRGSGVAGDYSWTLSTPVLDAAVGGGFANLSAMDTHGLWYPNPTVPSGAIALENKFIISFNMMGSAGNVETGAPISSNYAYDDPATPPSLSSVTDAPYYFGSDAPTLTPNMTYIRALKRLRYTTHQMSDYLKNNSSNQTVKHIRILSTWARSAQGVNLDNSATILDALDLVTKDVDYATWSATPVAARTTAMSYYNLVHDTTPQYPRSVDLGGGMGTWYESTYYWGLPTAAAYRRTTPTPSVTTPAGIALPAGQAITDGQGTHRFNAETSDYSQIAGQNDWGAWAAGRDIQSVAELQAELNDIKASIVSGGGGVASWSLDSAFSLYNYPGKPGVKVSANGGTATVNNGKITWSIPAFPEDGASMTIEYYVKLDDGANPDVYYPLFSSSRFDYDWSGVDSQGNPLSGSYSLAFPAPFVSGKGETKTEEGSLGGNSALNGGGGGAGGTSGGSGGSDGTGVATGTGSGGQQHQKNREMANSGFLSAFAGGSEDISPDVQAAKASTDSNGRSKVEVSLSNGSKMRYQWQFKNAIGEWEDIFGANGSHYTLGKQFVDGKEYELRCKITNPAGSIFFSDVVTVTMEKGSGSLQSRSGEVNIVGENVADAGEEIPVANTATNGMLLGIVAALAAMTLLALLAVAVKRRAGR